MFICTKIHSDVKTFDGYILYYVKNYTDIYTPGMLKLGLMQTVLFQNESHHRYVQNECKKTEPRLVWLKE